MFEGTSGLTHQMDGITAAVLMCFEDRRPLTPEAVQALLASDIQGAQFVPNTSQIESAMNALRRLGLILPA